MKWGCGADLTKSRVHFMGYSLIDELERMARDEKYAEEKMGKVQTAVEMSKRICEEFGYERGGGKNGTLSSVSVTFNPDGTTSIFAELEKTTEKQRERIESAREKRAEEKKAEAEKDDMEDDPGVKRVTLTARNEDELIDQLKNLDWDKI